MKNIYNLLAVGLLGLAATASFGREPEAVSKTALDHYIAADDPSYSWVVAKTAGGNPSETSVIKLTSQSWRVPGEVDRTAWEHWLIVVKPQQLKTDHVFLMVGGGGIP